MKKIINDPATVLDEMNRGFAAAYAHIVEVHEDPLYVCRAGGAVQGKVGVISGGGSGHEPLGGGYVGKGMLSAAAPGAFFSSPTPDQILAATQAADGGAGASPLGGELIIAVDPAGFLGSRLPDELDRAEALFAGIEGQGARLPSARRYAARAVSDAEGVLVSASMLGEIRALLH